MDIQGREICSGISKAMASLLTPGPVTSSSLCLRVLVVNESASAQVRAVRLSRRRRRQASS